VSFRANVFSKKELSIIVAISVAASTILFIVYMMGR
jgi:hypothetical protein